MDDRTVEVVLLVVRLILTLIGGDILVLL